MNREPSFSLVELTQASRPDLVLACQRLRYHVYHRDLGLDTPDMDHARAVDVEENDPFCRFLAVQRASDGAIIGCLRAQISRERPFYAEREFVLDGPWWQGRPLAEGARFAVLEPYRNGEVPLLLFNAFRAICRANGVRHLISVSIVPDCEERSTTALAVLQTLRDRIRFDVGQARPAPGYESELYRGGDAPREVYHGDRAAAEGAGADLPPMLRMLANSRTTLCSLPAYCRRFLTWNFLFVTRLERGGRGAD